MHDHGDVVLTAARVRELDEPLRRTVEVVTARADDEGDLFRLDMTREAVGAEHESVAGSELLDIHVGLNAARVADEARDAVRRDAAVILGDLTRSAVTHEVRAAVAEICDHRLTLGDGRRDERARGRGVPRRVGGAQHRGVRVAYRVTEALGQRLRARRREEARRELVDRGTRSDLAAWPSADAVGDGHERHVAIVSDEVAVFVPFPNAAGVRPRRRAPSH